MNDESQVRALAKAQREAAHRESERRIVVKSIMSHPAGREWIYSELSQCGIYHTPFTADPYATAFNCGQHNTGLRLLAQVTAVAPKEYLQMLEEQNHGRPDPSADTFADTESGAESD